MKKTGWFHHKKFAISISVFVLTITLIPLYLISHYNYPTTDDFAFANTIYQGLKEREALWTIVCNAWKTVANYYMTWQGRYFDVTMYTFGIGTAVPELYWIGTYLVLTSFVAATIWLLRVLTYKLWKWESDVSWIVSIWFTVMQLWYVPHAVEAFYWYAGATAYTLSFSLSLCLTCTLILSIYENDTRKKRVLGVLSVILSILVGGTNYAVTLLIAEIYVIAIVLCILQRKKSVILGISFATFMCGFACNAFAPGNKTRMAAVESLGVTGSIVASIKKAASFCVEWFHIPIAIFLLLIICLSFQQIANMEYDFKWPALFTIISFGLFASALTPPFYAGATWGPGRLINVEYYCYYFLIVGNILYWIGWLTHKWNIKYVSYFDKVTASIAVIVVSVLFLCCFKWYGLQSNNSTSALLSLAKGEAKQYQLENQKRWMLYEDKKIKDVEVSDFSVKPYVLYYDDIQMDSGDWRNNCTAQFFGKRTVRIK